MNNAPRRPARAEHDDFFQSFSPARYIFIESGEKANDIRVVAVEFSRFHPQGIHSLEPRRRRRRRGAERKGSLLVRQGDVAADEAALAEPREKAFELVGRQRDSARTSL